MCEEIMDLQKKFRYDLMYKKAQQLGGRTCKVIRTFGIEDNQDNIVTETSPWDMGKIYTRFI